LELGLILLAFITFVSLPHILFKTSAELFIDLGRRPDVSELEEIVTSIAPAIVLNLISLGIIRIAEFARVGEIARPDWPLIIRLLFADHGGELLAKYCESPHAFYDPLRYVIILMLVSFVNGSAYGRAVELATLLSADENVFPGIEEVQPKTSWQRLKLMMSRWADVGWSPFYQEYRHHLYPWSALKPYMYVRTVDANIYHGRFVNYEKTKDGDIESIRLEEVTRIRHNRDALIARGENPLRPLEGSLYMKWDRIADVNTVPPNHILGLWTEYEEQASQHRANQGTSTAVG
jgi:hypothetical protein